MSVKKFMKISKRNIDSYNVCYDGIYFIFSLSPVDHIKNRKIDMTIGVEAKRIGQIYQLDLSNVDKYFGKFFSDRIM